MNLSEKQSDMMNVWRKRGQELRTFFLWFCDNTNPVADEIAVEIKDDLWLNPLKYYLPRDEDDQPK